jgi:hypothetical protein
MKTRSRIVVPECSRDRNETIGTGAVRRRALRARYFDRHLHASLRESSREVPRKTSDQGFGLILAAGRTKDERAPTAKFDKLIG